MMIELKNWQRTNLGRVELIMPMKEESNNGEISRITYEFIKNDPECERICKFIATVINDSINEILKGLLAKEGT